MSNFKVNSKTTNLEFKRKHNSLVDAFNNLDIPTEQDIKELIQADKDILSQIEYDEENHVINFPKHVLPLRIVLSDNSIYFVNYNFECLVEDNGEDLNSSPIEISDGVFSINNLDGDITDEIAQIEYLLFDGENGIEPLNTYYLYNPQVGTKLYKHDINFSWLDGEDNIGGHLIIINNSSNQIDFSDFTGLDDVNYCRGIDIPCLIEGSGRDYCPPSIVLLIEVSGESITFTAPFNRTVQFDGEGDEATWTDTVTEL